MAGLLNSLQDTIEAKKQTNKGSLEQLKELAVAKLGKVYGQQASTGTSAQAEKRAQVLASANLDNVNKAVQNKQLDQQRKFDAAQQETRLAAKEMDQKQIQLYESVEQMKSELYTRAAQNASKLSFREKESFQQQAIFMEKLTNKKYLMELNSVWTKQNLRDQQTFDMELQRAIFADEFELLEDDIEFRTLLNADERAFRIEEANINNALAEQLLGLEMEANKYAGIVKGTTQIAKSGIQYYTSQAGTPEGDAVENPYGNYVQSERDTGLTGNYSWDSPVPTFGKE